MPHFNWSHFKPLWQHLLQNLFSSAPSWGGFSRLESPCCCEKLSVSCCERICVSCYSLLFKLFMYWVFSGFRMVLTFSSWALIMTASSFLAVLKRLSSLLELFNRLCPAVELLLKVLVLLNQPNDNVEISMNGLLSLSAFFIWPNQSIRASRQLWTVRWREEPPPVSSAAKGCSSYGARSLLGFNCL